MLEFCGYIQKDEKQAEGPALFFDCSRCPTYSFGFGMNPEVPFRI